MLFLLLSSASDLSTHRAVRRLARFATTASTCVHLWCQIRFDDGRVIDGAGLGVHIAIGYTPPVLSKLTFGLALFGVGGSASAASKPIPYNSSETVVAARPGEMAVGELGGFVEFYPSPENGFHAGGMFGMGWQSVSTSDQNQPSVLETRSLAGATWIGLDSWVSSQLSLGGLLALGATLPTDARDGFGQSGGRKAYGTVVSIMGSLAWH